ncbi:hypothetical protein [Rufibacter immobilis]|uniref:hypothetical protein n=1 Tax=Rufibacter immobilis TaxID=1348778 RepID=UPI0035E8459A
MEKNKQGKVKLIKVQQRQFFELEEIRLALSKQFDGFLSKSATIGILMESYRKHNLRERM